MKQLLLFACLLFTTVGYAQTTWYVSPTGDDTNSGTSAAQPWKTIRASVPKIASGDTLVALAGEYVSTTATDVTFWDIKNSSHLSGGVVIDKTINIKGEGANVTIFGKFAGATANTGGQFFEVKDGGSLTLIGVTLQNGGYDTNGGIPTRGGAILVANNGAGTTVGTGNLKLIRCNILKNTAKMAAAIAFISNGTFSMEGCYLEGNKQVGNAANSGGAGLLIGGGTTTITNCIFIENSSAIGTPPNTTVNSIGNILHATAGTVNMIHNTIAKNTMSSSQTTTAAVRIIGTAVGDKILNNLFYDNTFMDFWAAANTNFAPTAVVKGNVMMAHTNLPSPTTDNNVNSANTGSSDAIKANDTKTVAAITKVTFVTATGTAVVGKGVADASVPAKDIRGLARPVATPTVGATEEGTVSNQLPTVSITAPANNTVLTAPASVTLKATASDADGTISKVEFFNGTTSLGVATLSGGSYDLPLTGLAVGTYTITAKATDNASGSTTSTAITLTVNAAGNVLPVVSITTPANNTSLTAPAKVTLTANATDADGTISLVEFFYGTTKIGNGSKSGDNYSVDWITPPVGTHTITAKATDNASGSTTSTAITLTINAAPNVLPVVSITAPVTNSTYTAPATVNFTANATDSDGTISLVEFFNGTTKLGNGTKSGDNYTYTWQNVAVGTYTITAKATDNATGTTTSSAITVVVQSVNQVPTVAITDPSDQKLLIGPVTSVILMATAADPDGTISKVEFFNGATKLGDGTLANGVYTYTWMNPALGTYTLTATATDNRGATTTSTVVTLFIKDAITSTESEIRKAGLLIVPTASYNGFNISSERKIISSVRAFDRLGRVMTELHPAALTVPTIGENWKSGMYVLQIQLKSGETLVKKVIK